MMVELEFQTSSSSNQSISTQMVVVKVLLVPISKSITLQKLPKPMVWPLKMANARLTLIATNGETWRFADLKPPKLGMETIPCTPRQVTTASNSEEHLSRPPNGTIWSMHTPKPMVFHWRKDHAHSISTMKPVIEKSRVSGSPHGTDFIWVTHPPRYNLLTLTA